MAAESSDPGRRASLLEMAQAWSSLAARAEKNQARDASTAAAQDSPPQVPGIA
jgi:hypothetical protein